MPRLALLLLALWFLLLFVLRSILQWRRTGSTGFKAFSGRPGSAEWNAGATITAGLAVTGLAPVASLLGWPGGTLLLAQPVLHWLGAALAAAGVLATLAAQLDMGDSWRIGVDPSERTELVIQGLFARVRNPIFTFMLLSTLGFVLLLPNLFALLALALTAAGIEIQVRAVEEPYLSRTHGPRYADYAARVGRFVPGVGLLPRRSA
jgi:protein-S-isoprenylcysteine O-methyltransferase Ste14